MATLEIDGMRFTGTSEECAAFARNVRERPVLEAPPAAPGAPTSVPWPSPPRPALRPVPAPSPAAIEQANRQVDELALAFLRALRQAGSPGLDSEAVQQLVGATHPKGIGGKAGLIKNSLVAHGYKNTDSIYYSIRHQVEGRRWFAGSAIDDAILSLELVLGRRPIDSKPN